MINTSRQELNVEGFEPIYKGVPPFMKFDGGFGYKGVLLEHRESGKLQCHLCGALALNLSKHLFHKHQGVSPTNYRKLVGLNLTTPLMAPSTRRKLKKQFLDLTDEQRQKIIKRLLANNKKVHVEKRHKARGSYSSSEYQNRFGTCPEQSKTLFWEEYQRFGRIPTYTEMSEKLRYIVSTKFSSYKNALIVWGVSETEYRQHVIDGQQRAIQSRADKDYFPKYPKEKVKQLYSDFFFTNKRLPTWGEVQEQGLPGRTPFMRAFGVSKTQLEEALSLKEQ